ncbi:hypothetical protein AX768_03630 [Burkholderia sp. PAMC 28687]|uniref:hypothetical protein n=1 Tax=Burkholderia sp. PAMC 28687 TaxID=1795874 RepID=UPI0007827803|nr:hypothetical protein [Burkholderia sp. PAMC 28687]AMM13335.1 hypothetical protein AX768_03630 [Burkholderia sp. PAMC 28687]
MLTISIKTNIKEISKRLDDLSRKQMPFAASQAVNAAAVKIQAAEQANMRKVLDEPTPFTINSVGVKKGNKSNPTAIVFVKPIAAGYLDPYEIGGTNKLNSRALLKPIEARLNKYGNLPRNYIKNLLADPNVFVGPVTFRRSGQTINGIWMRPPVAKRRQVRGTARRSGTNQGMVAGRQTGLKLLIRFADAHPVTQRLGFGDLAQRMVPMIIQRELRDALAQAITTAK